MTDLELMEWALYALEGSNAYDWPVVEELKQRLAQPEQEPVAWMWADGTITTDPDRADGTWTPLYTAPRQWQGLTDEERIEFRRLGLVGVEIVEAKLKEKNA